MTARTFTDTPAHVPSIFTPTVGRAIEIAGGDAHIEVWGEYDADDGSLINVTINSRYVSWQNFDAALHLLGLHDAYSGWADDLDSGTLAELNADARRSAREYKVAAE